MSSRNLVRSQGTAVELLCKIPLLLIVACLCVIGWAASAGAFGGFIENRGQVDSRVRYYCPGMGAAVYFSQEAVVVDLKEKTRSLRGQEPRERPCEGMMAQAADSVVQRGCAVYIRFADANRSPVVEARGEMETKYNYFLGNDPSRWQTDVPAYSEVVYRGVWPGVDLVFRENDGGRLTYEAVLSRGANAQSVQFGYEGADRVAEQADGSVIVETPVGSLREERAGVGGRAGVFLLGQGSSERLESGGSAAPEDNPSGLLWGTFLGGSDCDTGNSLALDASGNVVVAGCTYSLNFPTTPGAYDTSYSALDVFVAKISASGSALLWSTFLGGGSIDEASSLVLDASGNVVLTGLAGNGYPTTSGAYDTSFNGGLAHHDGFVTKLSASGSAILWSTYLGGTESEEGQSLGLDSLANVVVAGNTYSSDFPTTLGAYDTSFNGGRVDAFAAKLSASGSALLWSTFIGGSSTDGSANSLVLDASGNVVITGQTYSPDFPTTPEAYDTSYNGSRDVYVVKLSASGSTLLWSTFLGGDSDDWGRSLVLDALGDVVVAGQAGSSSFPTTAGAYDTSWNDHEDVFVAKLSASGRALVWSTFLGGSHQDVGNSLVLDVSGNPVVAGLTHSTTFPTTPRAYDTFYNGGYDVFVAKMSAAGSALLYSTYLGGTAYDGWGSVVLDASGYAVVTGQTQSSDFPTTPGSYDTSFNDPDDSYSDAFVVKLDLTDLSGVTTGDTELGSARLYPAFPDPFGASTTVQFYLPEWQRVSIALYDVQGRAVRILVDGITEPGMHRMQWDGRSGNETSVAPGIYFLRMEAGFYRATKKAVLVK